MCCAACLLRVARLAGQDRRAAIDTANGHRVVARAAFGLDRIQFTRGAGALEFSDDFGTTLASDGRHGRLGSVSRGGLARGGLVAVNADFIRALEYGMPPTAAAASASTG